MNRYERYIGFVRRFYRGHLFSYLCVLCALCGSVPAQDFKTVHLGVEYAEVTREISGQQVKMNLLRLDLTKVRLDVVHAMDAGVGTEKTSSIATRHGAVAAINAGFFRLDNSKFAGEAAGLLMVNGRLLSESSKDRVALSILNDRTKSEVMIRPFDTVSVVRFSLSANDKDIDINGINRERRPGELVLYTPEFGSSTMTDNSGTEIVVDKCRDVFITSAFRRIGLRCQSVSEASEKGNNRIPKPGLVLSFAGEPTSSAGDLLAKIAGRAKGSRRPIYIYHTVGKYDDILLADWNTDVVAGVPQLIKNGKVEVTWEQEKTTKSFVETRHPRTAVAKLKDGKFLMITVDGRSESSGGSGLYDLANYLLELGATDAMNLDGGGSTTMFLDGKVVNHPSDKEGERKVSDAILVTLRKPSQNHLR